MIKLVIADDEERVCSLIYSLGEWEKFGVEVVGKASNGIEALEFITNDNIDILITDIRMPGCNGLELITKIKEINSKIKIIIVSGYASFEYAQTAIKEGVDYYLLKPVNKEELNEAVEKLSEKIRNGYDDTRVKYEILDEKEVPEENVGRNIESHPIKLAKKYIDSHYKEMITLEAASEKAGFTPVYFSTIFKREVGVGFNKYLIAIRIEAAKELLRETNASISSICKEVGYLDVKHFNKTFEKVTGVKPSVYRKLYG